MHSLLNRGGLCVLLQHFAVGMIVVRHETPDIRAPCLLALSDGTPSHRAILGDR